jgi:hypothetical protein
MGYLRRNYDKYMGHQVLLWQWYVGVYGAGGGGRIELNWTELYLFTFRRSKYWFTP